MYMYIFIYLHIYSKTRENKMSVGTTTRHTVSVHLKGNSLSPANGSTLRTPQIYIYIYMYIDIDICINLVPQYMWDVLSVGPFEGDNGFPYHQFV